MLDMLMKTSHKTVWFRFGQIQATSQWNLEYRKVNKPHWIRWKYILQSWKEAILQT